MRTDLDFLLDVKNKLVMNTSIHYLNVPLNETNHQTKCLSVMSL